MKTIKETKKYRLTDKNENGYYEVLDKKENLFICSSKRKQFAIDFLNHEIAEDKRIEKIYGARA